MIHIYVFYAVQALICLFAFVSGGRPERLAALLLLLAALGNAALPNHPGVSFHMVEGPAALIDLVLMASLVALSVRANRFWPLWLAALQLLAIAIHGVKAFEPVLVPWMYAGAAGKIAYPMMAVLMMGVWRHRRRIAEFGADPDWSPLTW